MRKYFGTDGVRGTANVAPMTANFALKLGQALGRKYIAVGNPPHQIVIGKDTRLSCYMFESAMVAGICSQGVDAIQLGVVPTPAVAFITRSIRANAGVVISASHNPYHDNGLKLFDANGLKLPDEVELELEQMVDSEPLVSKDAVGRAMRIETALGRYVEFVKNTFDKNMDLRGLKVVIDCANGAVYKAAPMAILELGAEIEVINNEPNGLNINGGCGSTYPEVMARLVKETRADLGISFDGDGDRLIVSDHLGNIVDGDLIMGICAIAMKKQGVLAKDTLVATVMSNQGFVNSLSRYGINVVRSQVGDRYVFEAMRGNGYNLGGEQSGHIIFKDYITTGDGLITALQLLKAVIGEGKTVRELTDKIELCPQVLKNIEVPERVPIDDLVTTKKIIEKVNGELSDEGRVLVRYSGTEKKLRIMVEGYNEDKIQQYAADIADSALNEIRRIRGLNE